MSRKERSVASLAAAVELFKDLDLAITGYQLVVTCSVPQLSIEHIKRAGVLNHLQCPKLLVDLFLVGLSSEPVEG